MLSSREILELAYWYGSIEEVARHGLRCEEVPECVRGRWSDLQETVEELDVLTSDIEASLLVDANREP